MKTLWQEETRKELCERLTRLDRNAAPQWGKMNCEQMLAHVADGLQMSLGKIVCKPKQSILRYSPFKQIIIYYLPFPKGVPTAPELLQRQCEGVPQEVGTITELMEEFCQRDVSGEWAQHPLFGSINGKDWGVLACRHIDHHLRQFGV